MASALQDLRKSTGYKTSKEFAALMGIPATTYSRYEGVPEKIPLKTAWALADKLGCSIDLVVGRASLEVPDSGADDLRGPVQRLYDDLSPRLKESLDDYLAYLVAKNADEQKRREAEERRRYEIIASRLERVFLAELDREDSEELLFGDDARIRAAFEDYVNRRADERQEPDVRSSVPQILAAYDRLHGTMQVGGITMYWTEDCSRARDGELEREGCVADLMGVGRRPE